MANTIVPRVAKLESAVEDHGKRLDKVEDLAQDHEVVIYGRDNCPGLVPRLDAVEKVAIEMKIFSRILLFIGAGFGASAIALIWAIITHSIELVH